MKLVLGLVVWMGCIAMKMLYLCQYFEGIICQPGVRWLLLMFSGQKNGRGGEGVCV